jgi:hypothetical protein
MVRRAFAEPDQRRFGAEVLDKNVTLKLRVHGRTVLSLLVSRSGDASKAVWLRKSRIVGERPVDGDGNTVELTMPEWLARSERLT